MPIFAFWFASRHWEQVRFAWLSQLIGMVSCCCGLIIIKHEQPDTWQHWSSRVHATAFEAISALKQLPVKEHYQAIKEHYQVLAAELQTAADEVPLSGKLANLPFSPQQVIYQDERLTLSQLADNSEIPEASLSVVLSEEQWCSLQQQGTIELSQQPLAVSWYWSAAGKAHWEERVGIQRFILQQLPNKQLALDLQLDEANQLFGSTSYSVLDQPSVSFIESSLNRHFAKHHPNQSLLISVVNLLPNTDNTMQLKVAVEYQLAGYPYTGEADFILINKQWQLQLPLRTVLAEDQLNYPVVSSL